MTLRITQFEEKTMSENKDHTENLGSSVDDLPHDFIAYQVMWMCPHRFVRKGSDNWNVLRWSDRWAIFENIGDSQLLEEYRRADQIFVRQQKIR
jgi:hypothetical protein